MLISRIAALTSRSSSFVPGVQEISIGDRRGSLSHFWHKLQGDIDHVIEQKNLRRHFGCQVLDAAESDWVPADLVISDKGNIDLYAKGQTEPFIGISLPQAKIVGHLSKVMIQVSNNSSEVLLNPSQKDFGELYATLLAWAQLRPAGISNKLWYPPIDKLDNPEEDLLRCEVKAHFTVYNPQYMKWSPLLARLKRNGEFILSDAQAQVIYSIQVRNVLSSRIRVMDTSVVDSRKVMLIFPDMGGPDSVYLKFNDIDDFEDWVATTKSLSRQQVAAPLDRDPRKCVRWSRSITVKIGNCATDEHSPDYSGEDVDLEDTYVDVCLNRWVFARTYLNSDKRFATWGQCFELPGPEVSAQGTIAPDQLEIRLKRHLSSQSGISSEKDVTLGSYSFPHVEYDASMVWQAMVPSNLEINVSASQNETLVLHADYYHRLYDWVSDLALRSPNRVVAAMPNSLSTLFPVFNDIYRAQGRQIGWIKSLASESMRQIDYNSDTLFREASLFTRSMESLLQQSGEETLQNTVGRFVRKLVAGTVETLELDPSRNNVSAKEIESNIVSMGHFLNYLWTLIQKEGVPKECRPVFVHMNKELRNSGVDQETTQTVMTRAIASLLFLRFYIPALLNPAPYNLVNKGVTAKHRRTLVLVAKIMQSFANNVRFGSKEQWLVPMNNFIEQNEDSLQQFYASIYETQEKAFTKKYPNNRNGTGDDDDGSSENDVERPQKVMLVKTFMGQQLTSPNLVDEWAAFARLVNAIKQAAEQPNRSSAIEQDDLVDEIVKECNNIKLQEQQLVAALEEPDNPNGDISHSPPILYLSSSTLLFGPNRNEIEAEPPQIKKSQSLTESLSRISTKTTNTTNAAEPAEETTKKSSTSSVRKLTQMLRFSKSSSSSSSSSVTKGDRY